MHRRVIFIVGPTAIGKTRLAIKLAKKINGEIVSCDSMQVYKGMRILSQSPSQKEQAGVRHHLTNIAPLAKDYNVAGFRVEAVKAIESIFKRRKIPIVVGGSGLYIKALIDGLFPAPKENSAFRTKMRSYVKKYGSAKLHNKLFKIDPVSAGNIHPNDIRRIIRALEIYELTGRTMTQLKAETKGLKDIYDIKIFGLTKSSRDDIYFAIDSRIDRMFEDGVVAEVKRLSGKKLSKTSGAVLGLKEISGYLKGEYDLDTAKEMLKMNTRRFAKRQLAWFRADKRIKWFYIDKVIEDKIINIIARKTV